MRAELLWELSEELGRDGLDVDARAVARSLPDSIARGIIEAAIDDSGRPEVSLGDVLTDDDLLTEEDLDAIKRPLLSWAKHLRGLSFGPRLPRAVDAAPPGAPPVPPPPHDLVALQAWAREHGVLERLRDPARSLLPFLSAEAHRAIVQSALDATVLQCADGIRLARRHHRSGAAGVALKLAALGYLRWAAGRRALAERRREREARPLREGALRRLTELLREALDALAAGGLGETPLFFHDARLTLEEKESPLLTLTLFTAESWGLRFRERATLDLGRLERADGGLALSCSCTDGGAACHHQRLLLEWALDALHDDDHPLHARLVDAAATPPWERMLRAFTEEPVPEELERQLVFRIGRDAAGRPVVEPAIRKRKPGLRFSRGARIDPAAVLVDPDLVAEDDRRILAAVLLAERTTGGRASGAAFEALVGHPRVFRAGGERVTVRRVRPRIVLLEEPGGVRLKVRIGEQLFETADLAHHQVGPRHVVIDDEGGDCLVAPLGARLARALVAAARQRDPLPPESHGPLLDALCRLQPEAELEAPPSLRGETRPGETKPVLRLDPLESGGLDATLLVRPLGPGTADWPPGDGPALVFGIVDGRRACAERDLQAEIAAAETVVAELALDAAAPLGPWRFRLLDPDGALDLVVRARERVESLVVEMAARWKVGRASSSGLRVQVRRTGEWFGIDGEVEVDGQSVPLAKLLEAVRSGRRYVRIGAGRFARLEEELRARLGEADTVLYRQGKELAVGRAAAAALRSLFPESALVDTDREWTALCERIEQAERLEPEVPSTLTTPLRGYQVEGYRWLARLAAWGAGACLADEMGLGKTVQALALLIDRAPRGPALVVAPTSVGANWMAETARFAPGLRAISYRGPGRARLLEGIGPGDVLVTSYDLMAIDADPLSAIELSTLVLDEAQAIKNARTARAQAAARMKADVRIALTGTPLENHLGELFSLYRVLSPGLFGPWEHFRARWALPIERDGDLARRDALARLVRPFLLRRTKRQVAPELPPRTEVVRPVELSGAERRIYDAARREAIEALAAREDQGEKSRFAVLAAITRLRQLACHPRLVDPRSSVLSSKLGAFLSITRDMIAQGERALVFSQFTSHLALVRQALDAAGYRYLYLDGSTPPPARERLVARWHEGEVPMFLISLRAGGTGLNLTGADTVVHLDPWWNPAVEDQAADRTHRIGQTRPVTVVRLICQGTIEEAVVALHEEKRELARGLLEGADAAGRLSSEDLIDLVRFGEAEPPPSADED